MLSWTVLQKLPIVATQCYLIVHKMCIYLFGNMVSDSKSDLKCRCMLKLSLYMLYQMYFFVIYILWLYEPTHLYIFIYITICNVRRPDL